MQVRMSAREIPGRVTAGAYILHAGLGKWKDDSKAEMVHGVACQAYPFLRDIPPKRFLRFLAVGEMAVGAALLTPVVPTAVAGAALASFSAGLMGLYVRNPGLRESGSIWPTPQGIQMAKDVWLAGIGLGFLVDALAERRGSH